MPPRGEEAANASAPEAPTAASDRERYQVFATLGRGGMAEVFLAIARGPRDFNKLVVLKRLRPHLAEETSFREMFLDEARLAARLNHPNVVQSYEVGEGNGVYYIAMEYLDGQPLDRLLNELRARHERIDPAIAARIVADTCSGLTHAHELRDYDGAPLRIIHRDVSPQNIFLGYDGQVKVVDFGIAKAAVSRARTEQGVLKGKIAYMAPEQAAGETIDARADLFAMGIVLWELVAGRQLFPGDNAANILRKLLSDPVPTPSSVVPAGETGAAPVDPKLEAIVMRALEKDPDARYQTARELRNALEDWLHETRRTARREDVGALVTSLFTKRRAQVDAEIQRHMAALRSPSSAPPGLAFSSIDRIDPTGASARRRLLDLATDATGDASGLSRRAEASSPAAAASAPERSGATDGGGAPLRRWAIVAVPVLVAAIALLCFRFVQRQGEASRAEPGPRVAPEPSAAASTYAPHSPPAPLAPPPSAPAMPEPVAAPAAPPEAPAQHEARTAPRVEAAPSALAPGFLTLDTYPWSNVSENGRRLGTTPLVHVSLPAGTHTLTLDNPDLGIHQTYEATVASGATLTKSLRLR